MKMVVSSCLILVFSAFIFSCAKPGIAPLPRTHLPPENLPGIDGKTSSPSMTSPRPPIVQTMIDRADKQLRQNQPEAAFQTLERALALDGRDPMVWHLMARARQIQGQYGQAESLARKSNTLAAGNVLIMEKNQEIIEGAKADQTQTQ